MKTVFGFTLEEYLEWFFDASEQRCKQLRDLWTGSCLSEGIECGSPEYQSNIAAVWRVVLQKASKSHQRLSWTSQGDFQRYMSRTLKGE